MKIELLDDRLAVKEIAPDDKIAGTVFYAPDTAKEKTCRGTVVAVGPGKFYPDLIAPQVHAGAPIKHPHLGRKPLSATIGDTVLYGKFSGSEHTIDGAKILIIYEHDVLAILERAK